MRSIWKCFRLSRAKTALRLFLELLMYGRASSLQASGTAKGTWKAAGTPTQPIISSNDLQVTEPSVGKYGFDKLTASVIYDGAKSPSELRFENLIAQYSHSGLSDKPDAVIT